MVKNKAKIAPESFYNPRASRALKRALDPGRKGLRASRSWCVLRTHESKIFYFQMLAGMQMCSQNSYVHSLRFAFLSWFYFSFSLSITWGVIKLNWIPDVQIFYCYNFTIYLCMYGWVLKCWIKKINSPNLHLYTTKKVVCYAYEC